MLRNARGCFVIAISIVGAALGAAGTATGQDAGWLPGLEILRGADDPEAIPMVKAYESIVRGRLFSDEQRGVDFLRYQVRLSRQGAGDLFAYAQDGWKRLVAQQLSEARSICDDRDVIQSKAGVAERIMSTRLREDRLRSRIFEGAFEVLDERDGEKFRRYVARRREQITVKQYDIERSIVDSPDSVRTLTARVCAHI